MKFIKAIFSAFLFFCFFNCTAQSSFPKTGYASFYHDGFEGRRTASGEILRQKKFTCAHKTLPFGTRLKVTNLENDKSIIVTVNDRGPYSGKRIIDVTKAAAAKLGFIAAGMAKVKIEVISTDTTFDSTYITFDTIHPFYKIELAKELKGYSVKIGSYFVQEKMFEVVSELKLEHSNDCEVFVQTTEQKGKTLYRVFAGKYKHRKPAEELAEKLKAAYPDCYVVEMKDKD